MFTFRTNIPEEEYNQFVSTHPLHRVLQSYRWAIIKNQWKPIYTGVYNEQHQLVAASLLLTRKVAKFFTFGYIPRGPIMDYANEELVRFYMQELRQLAKKQRLLFIKCDPAIVYRSALPKTFTEQEPTQEGTQAIHLLKKLGLAHRGLTLSMAETFQPRFEATTYLSDNLLSQYSTTCRNSIRRAQKRHVEITTGTIHDIERFETILQKTMERQHISLRSAEYFRLLMKTYPEDTKLLFAEINPTSVQQQLAEEKKQILEQIEASQKSPKKLRNLEESLSSVEKMIQEAKETFGDATASITIAGGLALGYGDRLELLYAGFDSDYRSYFPQYLLYLTLMEEAYKEGYKTVCTGGIEGTLDDGLFAFKSHFGPMIEEYIGEFDIICSPLLYRMFEQAVLFRKKMRSRKK